MSDQLPGRKHTWPAKFGNAFRGIVISVLGQRSFWVHLPITIAVIVAAAALHVSQLEWCVLLLCVVIVWTAEMLNTAIETMAKAIDTSFNPRIRDALDIAGGAVLTASIGAAIVGAVIFVPHVARVLGW